MKKLLYLIAAFSAVACAKEAAEPQQNAGSASAPVYNGPVTVLSASIEDETKTAFGPASGTAYPVYWQEGDCIVVNGCNSAAAQIDEQNPRKADFTIEGEVSAPLCAVYPKSAYVAGTYSDDNKTMDITIPATQTYAEGQYDPAAAIMLAYSADGSAISFAQAAGYYKLVIEGSVDTENIKTVKIRRRDGGKIAGTYTATFTPGGCTLAEKDTTGVITVDCGETGVEQGTEILVVLPAINFSDGLIITAYDVSGHFHSFGTTAVDFADANRAKILKKELTYNPQSGKITSAADWEDFAAQFNAGDLYKYVGNGTVVLKNDITAATYTRLSGAFKYIFDGNGKTITLTDGKNSLFSNIGIDGVVKNLTLEGTLTGGNASGGITVLAGNIGGGTVQDCINNADINVSGLNDHISVAAFSKTASAGARITRCVNNGDFTVNGDFSESDLNVYGGGIVARINGNAVLTDCKNSGDITIAVNNTGHKMGFAGFGGIVGWVSRDYASGSYPEVHFDNCDNEGTLTISNTDSSTSSNCFACSVGGILGLGWGDYVTAAVTYTLGVPTSANNQNKIFFKDCDNSGAVNNNVCTFEQCQKLHAKSYTGGLVGSMSGFESVFNNEDTPIFEGCTSTGDVVPYANDGEGMAERAGVASVCGGLVGIGAKLSFKNCTVTAKVGTAKRLMFACSGGIGITCGKLRFDGCTFYPDLYMPRCYNTAQNNWSLIATSPKYTGTTACSTPITFVGGTVPSCSGSTVKNCTLGAAGLRLNLATVAWNDTTATLSVVGSKFNTLANCETYGVQGTKESKGTYCAKTSNHVTYTDNTYSGTKPTVTGTPTVEPMSLSSAPASMSLSEDNTYNY